MHFKSEEFEIKEYIKIFDISVYRTRTTYRDFKIDSTLVVKIDKNNSIRMEKNFDPQAFFHELKEWIGGILRERARNKSLEDILKHHNREERRQIQGVPMLWDGKFERISCEPYNKADQPGGRGCKIQTRSDL